MIHTDGRRTIANAHAPRSVSVSPTQMTVDECIRLVQEEERKTLQEVMNEWPPAEPLYGGHN